MTPNKRRPITKQSVNESRVQSNSDLITISRSELKEIMNETLVNFLKSLLGSKLVTDKFFS
jgi:uncharacterized protein YbcI